MAIATDNMTNATAKFRWVLHQVEEEIRQGGLSEADKPDAIKGMMNEVYVGEMTPLVS